MTSILVFLIGQKHHRSHRLLNPRAKQRGCLTEGNFQSSFESNPTRHKFLITSICDWFNFPSFNFFKLVHCLDQKSHFFSIVGILISRHLHEDAIFNVSFSHKARFQITQSKIYTHAISWLLRGPQTSDKFPVWNRKSLPCILHTYEI